LLRSTWRSRATRASLMGVIATKKKAVRWCTAMPVHWLVVQIDQSITGHLPAHFRLKRQLRQSPAHLPQSRHRFVSIFVRRDTVRREVEIPTIQNAFVGLTKAPALIQTLAMATACGCRGETSPIRHRLPDERAPNFLRSVARPYIASASRPDQNQSGSAIEKR